MIAQEQVNGPQLEQLLKSNTSLKLEKHFPLEDINLICDMSTNQTQPFIPKTFRQIISENVYFLSHPGASATSNLISKRFVWPKMKSDIRNEFMLVPNASVLRCFRTPKFHFACLLSQILDSLTS
ncbi:transposon Tf2-9 polyprotein [Nephila pilipes]|uniref:Transposon Tf2-9 polyprotein n=1 Tax=Nephila pilipes TaxID=299642 RepID=A0A8X6QHH0_NEPPI|nr:transposon Tf2-9 polyprotein [Nephila pilipes]GFT25315.1 transposon Tf2-9 polyprotein [Nephila pilipes]GFT30718.1 transposon Tf2-9 polyprotein [Nephila pilipes]GFU18940.1 transposon Tf2-9 polyprotein [Nephila pilipes]